MLRNVTSPDPSTALRSAQDDGTLFRRLERFVEPRLATIGCVFVNDTALCSFIDCRDQRANLIHVGRLLGARLLLHRAQTRHRAAITQRAFQGLASTFGS
jgi:hypothetical protein